ncbi:DUF5682 family protein [Peribacillus sp. SCS-26]|uniref:DUF5682 family protein n=1 Tax=Paraperibacillus marinus TaxID=3115295 RepID=UPI0039068DCC
MAEFVSGLQRAERMKPHVFGVRHLSPAACIHLEAFLEEIKPTAILIEGPSDMTHLIKEIANPKSKPPLALMAYTLEQPVETIVYPLADYSPEYRAILWGVERGVHVEFIDLPSGVSMQGSTKEQVEDGGSRRNDLYSSLARIADEHDFESYWERWFEQNDTLLDFKGAMEAFGRSVRMMEEADTGVPDEYNTLRERYMSDRIKRVFKSGHLPQQTVVITGAYHLEGLHNSDYSLPLEEFDDLPQRAAGLTLMPYSYYKLSAQSGYGAGNHAPAYYQMLWKSRRDKDPERLPAHYLTRIAAELRRSGTYRSTAEVIEGVRLAAALASFRNSRPVLKDIRDAAAVCLGHGDFSVIADACARVEIGSRVGSLAEGASQTPLQADFTRRLKELKLEKYRKAAAQEIQLDLRENRRAKSRETAFRDLHRSFFFHQLQVLSVSFSIRLEIEQESASWAEQWKLRYDPEIEIQLVESNLLGETVEWAAAYKIREQLKACTNVSGAARLVRTSYLCGMLELADEARAAVARISTDTADFTETAEAVWELSRITQYGDVRGLDSSVLLPVIQRLFLRGTLLLMDAAVCNDEKARPVMDGIGIMNETALDLYEHVDESLWFGMITELSQRDDRNPLLSGYACGLLIERNRIDSTQLEGEVSRRLSPGIPADLGAGWFEGLCMGNKYALLSRSYLWERVDTYISALTSEEFRRALVFLRRALTAFSASDRAKTAELLAGIWGVDEMEVSEYLNEELSRSEEKMIDDLNDFDFGDLL